MFKLFLLNGLVEISMYQWLVLGHGWVLFFEALAAGWVPKISLSKNPEKQ